MNNIKKLILAITVSVLVTGCSAIDKQIKHGKLDVQTKMSETVFLDPVSDNKRTVVLQIRNTSDKKDLNIQSEIVTAIEDKGYKVVSDPNKAHFMIQANILQVGKATDSDPFGSMNSGFGGALAGGLIGSSISNNYTGMGVGVLAGGLIEMVADSAVEVVNYRMITDLQISEKAEGNTVTESSNAQLKQGSSGNKSSSWSEKSKWKKYQTRIISVAKKTNLKFELALPELKQGLVQSIAGLL
jgi:uncharacterized protein YdeI (BOF family)